MSNNPQFPGLQVGIWKYETLGFLFPPNFFLLYFNFPFLFVMQASSASWPSHCWFCGSSTQFCSTTHACSSNAFFLAVIISSLHQIIIYLNKPICFCSSVLWFLQLSSHNSSFPCLLLSITNPLVLVFP